MRIAFAIVFSLLAVVLTEVPLTAAHGAHIATTVGLSAVALMQLWIEPPPAKWAPVALGGVLALQLPVYFDVIGRLVRMTA